MDGQAIGRVFLGKTESFPNGSKAVPIELAEDVPTREEFNTKVLKKSAVQLKSYWSRRLFTGKGSPPKQLPSSDDIIDLVSTNPNIIGYVDAGKVNDSVKVIAEF